MQQPVGSPSATRSATSRVRAVAGGAGVEASEFDRPLYEELDSQETRFPGDAEGRPRWRCHVTFTYGRHRVAATSDRGIRFSLPTDGDANPPPRSDP